MSGHAQSSGEQDTEPGPSQRYRIKRRNASVGDNLKVFNKHLQQSTYRAGQTSLNAIHRTRGGRIESRPTTSNRFYNPHSNQYSYQHSRYSKDNRINPKRWPEPTDADGDLVMKGDPNMKPRDKFLGRFTGQARVTTAPGLPRELRSYKIGEQTSSQLEQSKSHCKLACMPDNVFELVVKFLKQYFQCYDTNRSQLLEAYHPKTLFSLSLDVKNSATQHIHRFGDYFQDSRNLQRLKNEDKRIHTLQKSNLETVAFINKMPPTEHDVDSFKLDTSFFTPNMLAFSIAGVFKEGRPDEKVRPYRSFQRSFVCIPTSNDQMAIVNEQYLISNLTYDQAKAYKSDIPKMEEAPQMTFTIRNEAAASNQPMAPVTSQEDMRTAMALQFAQASNLTVEWAKYCLEYANWDYAQAEKAFKENIANIPQEAFKRP